MSKNNFLPPTENLAAKVRNDRPIIFMPKIAFLGPQMIYLETLYLLTLFLLLLSFILSLFFSQINSSLETYFPDTPDKHHREKVFPTMRSLSGHDVKCQGVRCLRKVPVQDFPLTSCIFLETQYCWGLTFLIFKIKQAGLPLSCSNYFLNLQNPFLKENHMRNIKMEKILKKSFSGSIGEWGK